MKIFYDQSGLRWKLVKFFAWGAFGVWLFLISFFVFSLIFISPTVGELALAQQNLRPNPTDEARQKELAETSAADNQWLLEDIKKITPLALQRPVSFYNSQTMAFFTGDMAGLAALQTNMHQIDILLPLWLGLNSQDLTLKMGDEESMQTVNDLIAKNAPQMKIMPVISNYDERLGDWDGDTMTRFLSDDQAQTNLIAEIKKLALDNGWMGISLDLENVASADREKYLQFIRKAKSELKQQNLSLSVNLPAGNLDYDYRQFGETTDFVIVRLFDEHWVSSEPGPIASQKWFQEKMFQIATQIPGDRLVLSLGAVAYDWKDGATTATTISYSDAIQLSSDSGSQIVFDSANANSNFEYIDESGVRHQVYLLDAVSLFNQRQYASLFQPRGYAIWRLGMEEDTIWTMLRDNTLAGQLSVVENIAPLQKINYQGEGDLIQVKAVPQEGRRKVLLDQELNLISNVVYDKLPSGYVIGREGKKTKNTVALTFDDGPDPVYTPQILNILREHNLQATFFVLGSNVENNVELLKQISEEGHLIGSHTYTHSNVSLISDNQLNFELNSTQLLIESILNIKTNLFRPPYDADINPQTLEQIRPLKIVSEAGYFTVGNVIDPKDWDEPGVDALVSETVRQAEGNQGGVVLLHDGGGDQSQTVEALPLIIAALQDNGFDIVPLNEMIGVSPFVFNTPLGETATLNVALNRFFVNSVSFSMFLLQILVIIGLIVGMTRYFPIGIMAVTQHVKTRKKKFREKYYPQVSVIIAAYNEEKVIRETIENILESDYDKDKFEIIVVNDGSKDRTWSVLKQNFQGHPNVKIFNKRNGGKSSAVNYGIARASGEIMVSQDADTLIGKQTIKLLVRHFVDPKIGAVAGNAKVGNRQNLLTKFQALEYITSQNLDKRAFDMLNAITVVPGAIGAWRMDLIRKLGGLDDSTLAEDSDLTLRIIQSGFVVHFEAGAVAYTEAPMTLKALASQRFRWAFGTLQVLSKNKKIIANPKYKWLGMLGMPNVIFFQFFSPLVTPIIDLILLLQIILVIIQMFNSQIHLISMQEFWGMFIYYAIFTALDIVSCVLAFLLEKRENWKLVFWLIPQRFFYRFFLNWICIKSLITAAKGNQIGWNKLERSGNLKSAAVGQMALQPIGPVESV